jgi:hypothetical protein
MLRKPFYASLAALGLVSMMGIAGNAMATTPAVWVGTADYTQAPAGTAANAEQVGPFNEYDFSSAGVALLKTVNGDFNGYYQSFVNQHLLDGVIAPSAKLNSSYELTVAVSFQGQAITPQQFNLTGGQFDLYFDPTTNHNFNTDSGFTDGASILHGTLMGGSGGLFGGVGYTDLTIKVDSFNHNVFDPATIASGDSIFTLRLKDNTNATFLNPINSVMGQTFVAGDKKLAMDGNLILSVPEPKAYALMLSGLGMIGLMMVRRRNTM